VDLDLLGDPGEWIHEVMQDRYDYIIGDPQYLEGLACDFADAYIEAAKDLYFELPSDLGKTDEECWDELCVEFHGFLKEWSIRALYREPESSGTSDEAVSLDKMEPDNNLQ
jgi:hypothetical protein